MELGQKIKEARLAAGLSQKALCGDVITRNMLSLIESGRAKPSMQTLRYLAEQLGKPMSYFLEEDAVLSPNQALLQKAKAAFREGIFDGCLSALESYQPDGIFDDEAQLLSDLSLLSLAEKAIAEGRLPYAMQLLGKLTFQGLYQVAERKEKQLYLLAKLGEPVVLPAEAERLYLQAAYCAREKQYNRALALLQAIENPDPRQNLLAGKVYTALEDYKKAIICLQSAEKDFPKEAIPLLEQCYRELEDYKMAYAYALKMRGET